MGFPLKCVFLFISEICDTNLNIKKSEKLDREIPLLVFLLGTNDLKTEKQV